MPCVLLCLHLHTLLKRIKDSVMSSTCLMNMHKKMFYLHYESIQTRVALLSVFTFPGYSLHLRPFLNKLQLISLIVLKETRKWRRGNKQSTKSAEERDKTTLGQKRKEMKLGICPVCAWLDLESCFTYFIPRTAEANMWLCRHAFHKQKY